MYITYNVFGRRIIYTIYSIRKAKEKLNFSNPVQDQTTQQQAVSIPITSAKYNRNLRGPQSYIHIIVGARKEMHKMPNPRIINNASVQAITANGYTTFTCTSKATIRRANLILFLRILDEGKFQERS